MDGGEISFFCPVCSSSGRLPVQTTITSTPLLTEPPQYFMPVLSSWTTRFKLNSSSINRLLRVEIFFVILTTSRDLIKSFARSGEEHESIDKLHQMQLHLKNWPLPRTGNFNTKDSSAQTPIPVIFLSICELKWHWFIGGLSTDGYSSVLTSRVSSSYLSSWPHATHVQSPPHRSRRCWLPKKSTKTGLAWNYNLNMKPVETCKSV